MITIYKWIVNVVNKIILFLNSVEHLLFYNRVLVSLNCCHNNLKCKMRCRYVSMIFVYDTDSGDNLAISL